METNQLQVQAESSGVNFRITLKNFFCGFGGQLEVTTILNAGTEDEKILPTTSSQVNLSANGDFWEEGKFQEFITSQPEFQTLIEKALAEAAKPYQQ